MRLYYMCTVKEVFPISIVEKANIYITFDQYALRKRQGNYDEICTPGITRRDKMRNTHKSMTVHRESSKKIETPMDR